MIPLQLNLGCGQYRAERGWLNIDHPSAYGVPEIDADIYCDIVDLPFKDGVASRLYAGHVIEHFSEDDLYAAAVELDRVLEPGGTLMIVSPDMDRINALEDPEPWLLEAMRTDNEGREGEHHKWQPTAKALVSFFTHEGWDAKEVDLRSIQEDRWPLVAYTDWQCAIECHP